MPGRKGVFRGLFVSAVVCTGSACTALYFGDTAGTSSPPAAEADASRGGDDAHVDPGQSGLDATTDAGVGTDSGADLPCPNARWVDPFTDQDFITPFWTLKRETSLANLALVEEGAASPGSLYASAHDASTGQAYLQFSRGKPPDTWSFCLSFALKLVRAPDKALFGPRILTGTGGTNSTIAVELSGFSVKLAFYNDGCPDGGASCSRDERVTVGTIEGDQWTTITLVGELGASSQNVTTRVGGAPPRTTAVPVPMHGFAGSSLQVGISTLLSAENVELLIDDVRYDDTIQ